VSRRDKGRKGKHQIPSGAKSAAEPKKIPRVGEEVEYWDSFPVWSFSLIDLVAQVGGWIHLRAEDLDDLLGRFRAWESMTWRQILIEGNKQNHPIDVDRCCTEVQERLKVLKLDDLEQLVSLRINSTARVIGVRDRATFQILWWDPDHQVCPSHRKD
jgi:hypothetical protein